MSSAANPAPQSLGQGDPNRIGTLEFDFDIAIDRGSGGPALQTPDRLLLAIRQELLATIDAVISGAADRSADITVSALDIDLGTFGNPPDWNRVRDTLRQKLNSALSPYLRHTPTVTRTTKADNSKASEINAATDRRALRAVLTGAPDPSARQLADAMDRLNLDGLNALLARLDQWQARNGHPAHSLVADGQAEPYGKTLSAALRARILAAMLDQDQPSNPANDAPVQTSRNAALPATTARQIAVVTGMGAETGLAPLNHAVSRLFADPVNNGELADEPIIDALALRHWVDGQVPRAEAIIATLTDAQIADLVDALIPVGATALRAALSALSQTAHPASATRLAAIALLAQAPVDLAKLRAAPSTLPTSRTALLAALLAATGDAPGRAAALAESLGQNTIAASMPTSSRVTPESAEQNRTGSVTSPVPDVTKTASAMADAAEPQTPQVQLSEPASDLGSAAAFKSRRSPDASQTATSGDATQRATADDTLFRDPKDAAAQDEISGPPIPASRIMHTDAGQSANPSTTNQLIRHENAARPPLDAAHVLDDGAIAPAENLASVDAAAGSARLIAPAASDHDAPKVTRPGSDFKQPDQKGEQAAATNAPRGSALEDTVKKAGPDPLHLDAADAAAAHSRTNPGQTESHKPTVPDTLVPDQIMAPLDPTPLRLATKQPMPENGPLANGAGTSADGAFATDQTSPNVEAAKDDADKPAMSPAPVGLQQEDPKQAGYGPEQPQFGQERTRGPDPISAGREAEAITPKKNPATFDVGQDAADQPTQPSTQGNAPLETSDDMPHYPETNDTVPDKADGSVPDALAMADKHIVSDQNTGHVDTAGKATDGSAMRYGPDQQRSAQDRPSGSAPVTAGRESAEFSANRNKTALDNLQALADLPTQPSAQASAPLDSSNATHGLSESNDPAAQPAQVSARNDLELADDTSTPDQNRANAKAAKDAADEMGVPPAPVADSHDEPDASIDASNSPLSTPDEAHQLASDALEPPFASDQATQRVDAANKANDGSAMPPVRSETRHVVAKTADRSAEPHQPGQNDAPRASSDHAGLAQGAIAPSQNPADGVTTDNLSDGPPPLAGRLDARIDASASDMTANMQPSDRGARLSDTVRDDPAVPVFSRSHAKDRTKKNEVQLPAFERPIPAATPGDPALETPNAASSAANQDHDDRPADKANPGKAEGLDAPTATLAATAQDKDAAERRMRALFENMIGVQAEKRLALLELVQSALVAVRANNSPSRADFWVAAMAAAAHADPSEQALIAAFAKAILPDPQARMIRLRSAIARLGYAAAGIDRALRNDARAMLQQVLDAERPATPKTVATNPVRATPIAKGNRLMTRQSGLVLFHPYIAMLFSRMEIARDKKAIARDHLARASAALWWLASGAEQPAQPADPLINCLLGLTPDWPVPAPARLSADETGLIDGLIGAVISQWGRLGNTSADGLRAAFIQREGLFQPDDTGPQLTVTAGPYDMLLDGLPWAINLIALPWMPAPLSVKWRPGND